MRTIKHMGLVAVAAAALALAGCGGGGSSSSNRNLSGNQGSGTPPTIAEPTTPASLATDLHDKVAALRTLSGGVTADGSTLMMAKKYADMLGTLLSDGNSMTEMKNAAMVLKAKSDLMDAIDDIERPVTGYKAKLQKALDDLPDDADPELVMRLEEEIEEADKQIEEAEKVLNGDDLKMYVEMVTGDDEDDLKTAAYKGKQVAMAVGMALGPSVAAGGSTDANGAGLRVSHGTDLPAATIAKANKYSAFSNDPKSMTWKQIVTAADKLVMKMRIATSDTDTDEVDAASFADMLASAITTDPPTSGDTIADGQEYEAANYMGIPGTVFCAGDDCKVEGTGDAAKLTGSWYFTPTSTTAIYMKPTDDPDTADVDESATYAVDDAFVTYGHWLVVSTADGTEGEVTVNTFARYGEAGTTPTNIGDWNETAAGTPSSQQATYSGKAAGRSVHKTLDKNGGITEIQSGRFMADVMLTAKFGGTPMLGGTIDNFMSPDNIYAVDSSWTVKLMDAAVTAGAVGADAGMTKASGQDGTWSAQSYGAATGRPTGIFGGFNAHFTDGHVAGAYATRKD